TRRSVRYRRVCNHSATNSLFASFRSWVRIEGTAWRKRSKFLVDQQGKRVAVVLDVTEYETGLETRDQPAVDDQLGARDVAAGVPRQEARQPCQLARLAPAAEHRPLADRAPVLLAEFGGHVGKERPWENGVGGDPVRTELEGEAADHRARRRLRHCVG